MDAKVVIRDVIRLLASLLFFWLYLPHLICYVLGCGGGKSEIGYRC